VNSAGPLASVLRLNTRLFLNCLEGVSEEKALHRPSHSTNNMSFIACHLVDNRHFMAGYLGLESVNPFPELATARSIEDVSVLPTLTAIRSAWLGLSPLVEECVAGLLHDDLRAASPQRFPVDDPTVHGALGFLMQHESYHIGQMALLRKYVGLPAMTYKQG